MGKRPAHTVISLLKDTTGVILAGGENRRMPVPKALIRVRGSRLIERALRTYQRLFPEVFIITDRPEDFIYPGVKLLADVYDIRGPMTGILTALISSPNRWIFVAACDMPFLSGDVIRYMSSVKSGYDAVVSVVQGRTQPLFAFYSKRMLAGMERAVLKKRGALKDFLNTKRVQYVNEDEIRRFDPGACSFINFNTPEDLRRYTELNSAKSQADTADLSGA